jgi:phosphoglucosamine mutase
MSIVRMQDRFGVESNTNPWCGVSAIMVTSPVRLGRESGELGLNQKPQDLEQPSLNLNLHGLSPLEIPESVPLFGTDGIRGRVGEVLTASLALHVGYWAGRVFAARSGNGAIVVGQDSRNSSEMLAAALTAGLTAAGLEVWNVGLCPTPCVAYLVEATGAIGGAMISASHNPPGDNGLKFFGPDGHKLAKEAQQQIESALRHHVLPGLEPVTGCGRGYFRPELVRGYAVSLEQTLEQEGWGDRPLAGLKVVLDTAWGASAKVAPAVFEELGATVIVLHGEPDGDRINVNCGSTHLESLKAAVVEHQADLGFAFDGDADRVLAVDGKGRVVDGDYILYFWGQTLRSSDKLPEATIVSTVMANLGFERAWQKQGGNLIRTAVGDQYVQKAMLDRGYMLGGEQSGHILCRHYAVSGDGTLVALHLAALVKQSGRSLAAWVDDSFQKYPQLLENVRVEDRARRLGWQDCAPVAEAIAQAETQMGDAGRILVRASGTEPVIRVMVEAAEADLVRHWADRLAAVVRSHLS